MRQIYLLRGAPGSGKSTWIRKNKLEPFTISSDNVRMLLHGIEYDQFGKPYLPQKHNKQVWKFIHDTIESKMKNGDLIIVDATFIKVKDIQPIKKLASQYRYRFYIVDFTDITKNKLLSLNRQRSFQVPDYVIERYYNQIQLEDTSSIDKYIINRYEAIDNLRLDSTFNFEDLNKYSSIVVIGDIHGCYTALRDLFKQLDINIDESDYLPEDTLFIFLGDFIDRGIENAQVMHKIIAWSELPNVRMCEGNHERWLDLWAHNLKVPSPQFSKYTAKELQDGGISKKEIRKLYRKLAQCFAFMFKTSPYHTQLFFICHGGISTLFSDYYGFPFASISSEQLIKGTGNYENIDESDRSWDEEQSKYESSGGAVIQIHGHRSSDQNIIHPEKHVYSLEGGVEFGGNLFAIKITHEGIEEYKAENTVYHVEEKEISLEDLDVEKAIEHLRKNEHIKEKAFGNISSFNFDRTAFFKNIWDGQTIHARGLFIDTENKKIAARSYDKFFNIGQLKSLEQIADEFEYPVSVYQKENGYLGMVSYDIRKDDLFVATKSSVKGDYADWFREILVPYRPVILEYLRSHQDVTFVFEVIDPIHDPHIIEYDSEYLFLLDIVKNDLKFQKYEFEKVENLVEEINKQLEDVEIFHKQLIATLNNKEEFLFWYDQVISEDLNTSSDPNSYDHIEGYVLEDQSNYMVKLKLPWYLYWKSMRRIMQDVYLRGKSYRIHDIEYHKEDSEKTYNYIKQYVNKQKNLEKSLDELSIIELRNCYCKDW